jgi:type II secretory pathway pseudopilin PulG
MINEQGFNLIELIIFIILLGIGIGVLVPLVITSRYVHRIDKQTEALELAQQRMELILAQKNINGFSDFIDPCSESPPHIICSVPSNYTVTATIANDWLGDPDYKVITVTTSGDGNASLQTLVANY